MRYLFNELLHSGAGAMQRAGYASSPDYAGYVVIDALRAQFPGEYDQTYRFMSLPMGDGVTGAAIPLMRPLNLILVNSDMFGAVTAKNIDDFIFMVAHETAHLNSTFVQHMRDSWQPGNPSHDALDTKAFNRSQGISGSVKKTLGF